MKYFSGQGAKKSVRNQLVFLCERSLVVAGVGKRLSGMAICGFSRIFSHLSYLSCLILYDFISACWVAAF